MLPTIDDYQYDVFFSYKRHALTLDWTRGVHSRLKLWLQEEVPDREVRLFVDDDDIETGERWPDKLKQALRLSRCMVCVWSPSYFRSDWCVSEWQSFLEREKMVGVPPHGLIAPIRFHDGEHFPDAARVVQWTDVSQYTSSVPSFWNSQRAIELEDRLKSLAKSVQQMIQNAPAFRPDWPIVELKAPVAKKIELVRL
jgi:hypothetical protein